MAKLDARCAWAMYIFALLVAIGITDGLGGLGNILLSALLSAAIFVALLVLLLGPCLRCCPAGAAAKTGEPLAGLGQQSDGVLAKAAPFVDEAAAPAPKPRLHYLDNIKIFLTAVVVEHHTTGAFAGKGWTYMLGAFPNAFQWVGASFMCLNQTYFMCMFFFISGYFTPSSCDRKGEWAFLRDKFKRLGIPFLIYILALGPLLNIFVGQVAVGAPRPLSYMPDPGPCWFLAWLLVFTSAYTLIGGPNLAWSRPSLGRMVLVGIPLGLLQGGLILGVIGGNLAMMPISFGSLPFDILFFTAGVAARRRRWLEDSPTPREVCAAKAGTVLLSLLAVLVVALSYYLVPNNPFIPRSLNWTVVANGTQRMYERPPSPAFSTPLLLYVLAGGIFFGVTCMVICFAMLAVCRARCNCRTPAVAFLSEAAYTVYLIHPWVLVPVTFSWVCLLEACGGPRLRFADNSTVSTMPFGDNDGLVWLGWFYTTVVVQLVVWPLAWLIRRVPGFSSIL